MESRTVVIPQARNKSSGINKRVLHNTYVFFCDLPCKTSQIILDEIVERLEQIIGEDIWDISFTFDYTAEAPDGSEGVTTIRLSTAAILNEEYRI